MAKRQTIPVKLHDDVVESARIVSAINGRTMTDLLSDILRPVLKDMETKLLAERTQAISAPPVSKKK